MNRDYSEKDKHFQDKKKKRVLFVCFVFFIVKLFYL